MSQKTAKSVTNKFLNTAKSDRGGGRTVRSGRVDLPLSKQNFFKFISKNLDSIRTSSVLPEVLFLISVKTT